MNDMRRVLRFLYDNPASTLKEISEGTNISKVMVNRMIKNELSLDERVHRGVKRFMLPNIDCRQ